MTFLKRQRITPAELQFNRIVDEMTEQLPDVSAGPMMSSPGIKYKGKVFAFFMKDEMGFRLGKETDPNELGITAWKPLNPFKNKGPLPGWFVVSNTHSDRWEDLATYALEAMQKK